MTARLYEDGKEASLTKELLDIAGGCHGIISKMTKDNQSLIITTMVIGAVLIIALAFLFTRNDDDTAAEISTENNVLENEENETEVRESEQQPVTPEQPPTPEQPVTPENPEISILAAIWSTLTNSQKTALNPYDCPADNNGIVYLSAETGECLEAPAPQPNRLGQPFTIALESGQLQLKAVLTLECKSVKESITEWSESSDTAYVQYEVEKFAPVFNAHLQSRGWNPDSAITGQTTDELLEAISANLEQYDTDLCDIRGRYENVGAVYPWLDKGLFINGPCGWPKLMTDISVIADDGKGYEPVPDNENWWPPIAIKCLPPGPESDLLSTGEIVSGGNPDDTGVWMLPANLKIDHFVLRIGAEQQTELTVLP